MATRIAAAGGGNWTAGGTWVGGVAPTAADDAQLTVASGNVTIDTGAVARSLDCTGYTGTLTHTAATNLTLGDATAGAGNVILKLAAGMTYTAGSASSGFNLITTSATQQTITTAGKTLASLTVNGVGASFLLSDAMTIGATSTLNFAAGTFNTGNQTCSWGLFTITLASAKTLTLGSSAIAITGSATTSVNYTGSNATFTANTATMTLSGAQSGIRGTVANWNGLSAIFTSSTGATIDGHTLANVTYTGPANKLGFIAFGGNLTVTGTLTITGNSTVNRLFAQASTVGTTRTVTVTTAVSLSNVDFMDITAAGAAGTWTGTSMGNALGNSNITFDAPATQTHTASAGGNWSDVTKWTSRVPLPQDNVVVDVGTTGTLTADMPRLGADVTFTGFAGTAAFNSTANTLYGSLVLGSGMTISGTQTLTLSGRSAGHAITSNGKTLTQAVTITAPGGTYTLVDAFATAIAFVFNGGTFATANFGVTCASWSAQAATATTTLGTSTITLTSTAAVVVFNYSSGAVLSGASATVVIANASANARSIALGSRTLGTLTYTVAGSTGSLTFNNGDSTIGTINFSDVTNARSLLFTAGTTTTVTNWNVNGTAGKLMTVDSATAATHTLSKPTGTVSSDYLSVKNSLAGGGAFWYAGANSTDAGGNTGWIFTAPPLTTTNFFFMFEGAMV